MEGNDLDVLGLVLRHVVETPEHEAVKDPDRALSYGELGAEVCAVANCLAATGVEAGDRVALGLGNSVNFVVAALACAWLGAIFVPLAEGEPAARRSQILENCDPTVVVVASTELDDTAGSREFAAGSHVEVDIAEAKLVPASIGRRSPVAQRPAYCIYTSGTTGAPKGVLTGHRAFAAASNLVIDCMGLHRGTRALCVSPVHFVGSFGTIFPVLAAGGTLVIPPRESLCLPRMFFKAIALEQITHTSFSPTYLRLLLGSAQAGLLGSGSLVTMALGGEALTMADLASLWAVAPELTVFNRYGQTETTGLVTACPLYRETMQHEAAVPIGVPHDGVSFYILGEGGHVADGPGEIGELYIGGRQLMDRYWGDPVLTAAVLRDDLVAGETLYRTGDLVRRDNDGVYFMVGRTDQMVKRSGIRISLLEVASALASLEVVSAAVCLPYEERGHLAIAAFITTSVPSAGQAVRHAAARLLPTTMLPDRVEIVEYFPMTPGSKVDEQALLASVGLRLASQVRG